MPKRKQDEQERDSDSDISIVDVDFEFFDPNPKVDYTALKRLLQQLFHADAALFQLHELADLILSQPLVGTTIKTDGIESDPLAFLTVLNLHTHKDHPSIRAIVQYLLQKISPDAAFASTLQSILRSETSHVGLIIGERVYNMPPQVMPPMYRMLQDEIGWAVDENEPYKFTHYLVLSRIWRWTAEEAQTAMKNMQPTNPLTKKRKKKHLEVAQALPTVNSYHPEDECIQKIALHTSNYDFTHHEPREGPDAFGTDIGGRAMLIPAAKLGELVQTMAEVFPQPQPQPQP